MSASRIYLLDGGTLEMDGFHVFWNRGPGGPVRIPCYSVLVVHPEGNILYDTGYDLYHVLKVLPFERPLQNAAQTVPEQLALVGLGPADIAKVLISHFHFDHCGGVKHLPNADVIAHRLEFEAADKPEPFEALGYSDLSFASDVTNGDRLVPMEGDVEIASGVHLISTPGHSRGHYSLMVELAGRAPLIFAGDAIYTQRSLDLECIAGFHYDPVASIRSMRKLKALAEERHAALFFSHEEESYSTYLKAPAFYS
ncbi:MAG TPA: N-acyl homoserine lactonase family protein [Thermoleophilia bacterium]|nr:N-acyl homoserine lactonase family protein [Thermoleophilia bacterium]